MPTKKVVLAMALFAFSGCGDKNTEIQGDGAGNRANSKCSPLTTTPQDFRSTEIFVSDLPDTAKLRLRSVRWEQRVSLDKDGKTLTGVAQVESVISSTSDLANPEVRQRFLCTDMNQLPKGYISGKMEIALQLEGKEGKSSRGLEATFELNGEQTRDRNKFSWDTNNRAGSLRKTLQETREAGLEAIFYRKTETTYGLYVSGNMENRKVSLVIDAEYVAAN